VKTLYTGKGRDNKKKVNYVLENWKELEYRTMETNCKEEAEAVEGLLKAKNDPCLIHRN
jgi:peptidyl-tRNA hydrolase